ncbi:MAG: hypothetical protein M3N68_03845 [Actinomycetota bacterium]|nr:hypothetical protein [Actinomycetota bacterium]
MTRHTCPSCGNELPSEMGQHADDLLSARVTCPHCGTASTLREGDVDVPSGDYEQATAAPPGRVEGTESFSGRETVADVAEELRDKPQ